MVTTINVLHGSCNTIEICERGGVPARYLADVFRRTHGKQHVAAEPLTALPARMSSEDGRLLVKRWEDVVLGGLALVAVSPVLGLAALAIKLTR